MADLVAEALQLIQKAQQYIVTPEQPTTEQFWHDRMKERAAKRSPYQQGRKFCGFCGVFLAAKYTLCPECGKSLRLKPKARSKK